MSNYVPIIGLEIHAELTTESKLFCRCANTSSDLQTPPNTAICPVCLGLPGALPVLNEAAVVSTVQLGQSLGSTIPATTKWDRKNYFYPDLPKGYQISQYDQPLCLKGVLGWIDRQGTERSIALTRIHLEEDTGKLVHPDGTDYSLIDYNRSSIPLLELVTEPVIASAEEARQCGEEYQLRLRELGIAEASMEKGQMRCEANISVVTEAAAQSPETRLSGTKVEIKNLNSFRSLERAIAYEIKRQSEVLESGGTLQQETRGWNEAKGETYVMRTKETADDYRYFPEPDLGQLDVASLSALEVAAGPSRRDLFRQLLDQGLEASVIHSVVNDAERLPFLQSLLKIEPDTTVIKLAVQWINQEPIITTHSPIEIAKALKMLANGSLPAEAFKQYLVIETIGGILPSLEDVLKEFHVGDEKIRDTVARILEENPSEVERYKAGQVQLFGFFVGQVRKELHGKGDPVAIAEELKKQLH